MGPGVLLPTTLIPPPPRDGRLHPLGRIAEVRDVPAAVLWPLSDEASYITGSISDISGGRVMQ